MQSTYQVQNSGVSWGAPWSNVPELQGWDRVMSINVKSIFYLTAALTPLLTQGSTSTSPGRVVNISSVASLDPVADGSPVSAPGNGLYSYGVSKAAVNHLTSVQAVSLGPKHITVNAILPGIFPSRMTAYGLKMYGDSITKKQLNGTYLCVY